MRGDGKALGVVAALFYIFLWASAYVPSKIGVLDSSPLWFLVVRFLVAGVMLVALGAALRRQFPATLRMWALACGLGVLSNAIYLGLTYEALRHLASGVGAIVASLNPLVLALIAPFVLGEPLRTKKIAGLVLGFGGVVAVMIARTGTGTAAPHDVALAFSGVLGSVAATIVFKRWCAGVDLLPFTGVQLIAAGVVLLPLAVAFEGAPHQTLGPRIIAAFTYLVFVISIGASLLWLWLLRNGDASRVSAYYFLTPVFGLALSAILLGEHVSIRDAGGLAAIVFGIALVQRG